MSGLKHYRKAIDKFNDSEGPMPLSAIGPYQENIEEDDEEEED